MGISSVSHHIEQILIADLGSWVADTYNAAPPVKIGDHYYFFVKTSGEVWLVRGSQWRV